MTRPQLKAAYFVLEGTNAFATSFYFYYLFFLLAKEFGYGNLENLVVSAVFGFCYVPAAVYAGRFGQRYGCVLALRLGFTLMMVALVAGLIVSTALSQIACLLMWTVGMCFTWPILEAMVSEGETPGGLQRMVGIYNLTWAGGSALAYFTGGAIIVKLGLTSIYWIPIVVHALQLVLLSAIHPPGTAGQVTSSSEPAELETSKLPELNPRPIARAKTFLRMAWVANPFAYVAINTLAAVIPSLAAKFNLSLAFTGFFCSVWFFSRWFTFLSLWLWPGWHYKTGWFFGAFGLLIASFVMILTTSSLIVVVVGQVVFGMAVGLIYYSSLFYSMDVSQTKAAHGGIHEAAIGLGIFLGPCVGATALKIFPHSPNSGTVAVTVLLCFGLTTLAFLSRRSLRTRNPQ